MRQVNKTLVPTELGPWLRGISYREMDDFEEGKEPAEPSNAHTQKRTHLRLPHILHTERNALSSKKPLLKMSHQSLDLAQPTLHQTSSKSRYGALNGSLLHTKGKGGQEWRSIELQTNRHETIDLGSLERKVSMVQMGEPVVKRQVTRVMRRRLMNEECAKKRSLLQFIRQVSRSKQAAEEYLQRGVGCRG